MRPAPFTYQRATSLADAIAAGEAGATPLAGGQSLLAAMKLRQQRPESVVDVSTLTELEGIEIGASEIQIGALTKHRTLAADPGLREVVPWLCEAASLIGDVQVRNRGTLGGNVCFADPRANLPPVLLSLRATARLSGPGGQREVPLDDLFRGFRENALASGEILTAVSFAKPASKGAYLEIAPQKQGVPLVNVAVTGGVRSGVAVGGLAPTPLRLTEVEEAAAVGVEAGLDAYDRCAFDPVVDLQAGATYRVKAGRALLRRALEQSR